MIINEMYLSIQGEGIQAGLPTFFVRFTGCNLRCNYCDTKYAYNKGKEFTIDEIIKKIKSQPFKRVSLTGGEPLLQKDIKILIRKLLKLGYFVNIETNGSVNLRNFPKSKKILYSMDIKCPSSFYEKSTILNNLKYLTVRDQIKFIMQTKKDYEFAKNIIKNYKFIDKTNIIFQPVGGINAKWIIKEALTDKLDIRIGLQIQKIIWGRNKKRV